MAKKAVKEFEDDYSTFHAENEGASSPPTTDHQEGGTAAMNKELLDTSSQNPGKKKALQKKRGF